MRFLNADGRAGLLVDDQVFDLHDLSSGTIPAATESDTSA